MEWEAINGLIFDVDEKERDGDGNRVAIAQCGEPGLRPTAGFKCDRSHERLIATAPELLTRLKEVTAQLYLYRKAVEDRQAWTGHEHGSCHVIAAINADIKNNENLIARTI